MKRWVKNKHGFTIVELLIVVVVIAILAAITIVAYNGIQNRAKQSALQSSASQLGKRIATYGPLNNDQFPDESTYRSDLNVPADSASAAYVYYTSADRKRFCVSITDSTLPSQSSYAYTSNGQLVAGRCIKNMITNPSAEVGIAGWSVGGGAQIPATTSVENIFGQNAVNQIMTTNGTSYLYISGIPVTLGTTYRASITVKNTSSTARSFMLGIVWRDAANGAPAGQSNGDTISVGPNETRRLTAVGTQNNSSIVTAQMQLRTSNGATGERYVWDGALFVEGSTEYAYGDGSSPNWSWWGEANNSTSFGPSIAQ